MNMVVINSVLMNFMFVLKLLKVFLWLKLVFFNDKFLIELLFFKELRSQFRSLSHLPLTCEFQVIEIRLHPPLISPATLQVFAGKIRLISTFKFKIYSFRWNSSSSSISNTKRTFRKTPTTTSRICWKSKIIFSM